MFCTGKFLCSWMYRIIPRTPGMIYKDIDNEVSTHLLQAHFSMLALPVIDWLPLVPNPLFFDVFRDTGIGACKYLSMVSCSIPGSMNGRCWRDTAGPLSGTGLFLALNAVFPGYFQASMTRLPGAWPSLPSPAGLACPQEVASLFPALYWDTLVTFSPIHMQKPPPLLSLGGNPLPSLFLLEFFPWPKR